MPDPMVRTGISNPLLIVAWVVFFATGVYGHAALKLAVVNARTDGPLAGTSASLWAAAFSLWGLSAFAAWSISSVCWMLVLSRQGLLSASSISSLNYVFICIVAVALLNEPLSVRRLAGIAAVTVGIWLVK